MSFAQILLIAVALSADAFAAAVSTGIAMERVKKAHTLRVALHFGGFQGGMVVLGWLAGGCVQPFVTASDHWVAFGLLVLIGGKMMLDSIRRRKPGARMANDDMDELRLLGLSVATSIDAFAVGASLAMLNVAIWRAALVVGAVTAILSAAGIEAGDHFFPARLGKWAEVAGGAILVIIAIGILKEHLG